MNPEKQSQSPEGYEEEVKLDNLRYRTDQLKKRMKITREEIEKVRLGNPVSNIAGEFFGLRINEDGSQEHIDFLKLGEEFEKVSQLLEDWSGGPFVDESEEPVMVYGPGLSDINRALSSIEKTLDLADSVIQEARKIEKDREMLK